MTFGRLERNITFCLLLFPYHLPSFFHFLTPVVEKEGFFVTAYFLLLQAQKPLMAELWSYPITCSGPERSSKPVCDHRKEEGTELGCILLLLKTPSCGTMGRGV